MFNKFKAKKETKALEQTVDFSSSLGKVNWIEINGEKLSKEQYQQKIAEEKIIKKTNVKI